MSKYTNKDAAKDTGSSGKDTAAAHNDARTDSGVRDGKDTESLKSSPDWAKGATTDSGIPGRRRSTDKIGGTARRSGPGFFAIELS